MIRFTAKILSKCMLSMRKKKIFEQNQKYFLWLFLNPFASFQNDFFKSLPFGYFLLVLKSSKNYIFLPHSQQG